MLLPLSELHARLVRTLVVRMHAEDGGRRDLDLTSLVKLGFAFQPRLRRCPGLLRATIFRKGKFPT